MRTALLTVLAATLLLPAVAEARPRHAPAHRPAPHVRVVPVAPAVRVVVSPWMFGYRPAPRTGWVWVDGYTTADGAYMPGYWAPATPRPGYDWVPGHWEGDRYVEGYWREAYRPGFTWVDGYYDRGQWIDGYWAPLAPPPPEPPPPGAVHHDYE